MKTRSILLLLPLAAVCPLCSNAGQHEEGEVNRHMHRRSFDELVTRFEDPERTEWQKPDVVVAGLGDLSNRTVADIGAGTGYFAFPISEEAGKVIAIDIDQRMLDFIDQKKAKDSVGANIETRLTQADDPGLAEGEADVVLIVNTYHHIENRVEYLEKLASGMAQDGRLVIIDFFKRELPVGPPSRMKLAPAEVTGELANAGFRDLRVDAATLPYQYTVTATRPSIQGDLTPDATNERNEPPSS